jgi:hypothetical protein
VFSFNVIVLQETVQREYGIEMGSTHDALPSTAEIMKFAEAQLGFGDGI